MKTTLRRTTVYFDPKVYKTLAVHAAATDQSVSDLVNNAVEQSILEDIEDLRIIKERENEPYETYGEFVAALKKDGKL